MMKKKFDIIKSTLSILLVFFFLISVTAVPVSATPNSTIRYGFWPYYLYPSSYQPDWGDLTHVAYYYWEVNRDGTLNAPTNISNYNTVKDLAHKNGVKVIICILSPNQDVIDNILANHREEFANNVLETIQKNGADGVNLDLEVPSDINTITKTSNTVLFEEFMKKLYMTLKTANPAYHISFDVSGGVRDPFHGTNLHNYTDSVFLMGYDYSAGNGITGANSPYNDDSIEVDIVDSINILLNYFDKQQIILGLPFYGYDFTTTSYQKGTNILSYEQIYIGSAIYNSQIYGRICDSNSHTPWYRYQKGNTWHQVWYDDEDSLRLKYQYAKDENLGGVGFWALGYEKNYRNIWEVFQSDKPIKVLPTAAFTASATTETAPVTIKFFDESTGSPTSWLWNFGDKSTSADQNPVHKYATAGKYTVSLTATNDAGNNTVKKSSYIKVIASAKPVAAFSVCPTYGKTSLTVKFTDKSTGSPTSWFWNFGDKSTSTDQNPTHKYTTEGKYTVSLTATNDAGTNTIKKSSCIKVARAHPAASDGVHSRPRSC